MEMLGPSGYKAPPVDGSDMVIGGSESSTDTNEQFDEKGCKSVVVGSSTILVTAVLFVSALAVKKRED